MRRLWWDLETYSEIPINNGAYAYAEGAEVLLFAYAVDDRPVSCWDLTVNPEPPGVLLRALDECAEHWGHNCGMFDRTVLKWARPDLFSDMPLARARDTLVQALCHGLPGSLDRLSDIFKLPAEQAKDKRGKQLIQMFCKPQPKNQKLRRKTRLTHPKEWAEFIEYAKSDITSMQVLHDKMPKWNYPNNGFELSLWQIDQRINTGGIYVDMELAKRAIEAVDAAQTVLAERTVEATDGVVGNANQRDRLLAFILSEYGVGLSDMRADTLERRLGDPDLPDGVRDLIAIRLMASTSSVSKFKRLIKSASSDGYLRGTCQFAGAGRTGRDAGRLFQPTNIMRPTLPQVDIDFGIEAIKAGCADLITDNVMELTANTMRGVIVVPPGKKMVVGDLANIEGRAAAWLADQRWKLQAFEDYDAGTGPDLYIKAYAEAFRVSPESVTKALRQVGKVMELMLAYGGGVGAFLTGAATYRLDLDALTESAREAIPDRIWGEACDFLKWQREQKRPTYGLLPETFIVCDSLKRMWREANADISRLWPAYENAARCAIDSPGKTFAVGPVSFERVGNWMRLRLPSGRSLSYPSPRNETSITYMGMNQYSRKWERIKTYGGKLLENVCQAFSRDVLFYNVPGVLAAGYDVRLKVHDELVCYTDDVKERNPEELAMLMTKPLVWAPGLPLSAAGFEGYRYHKE